jgi:hypothetical protein
MDDRRFHRLCAWAGPAFAVLFGLGFWLPALAFFTWVALMTVLLLRAIRRD